MKKILLALALLLATVRAEERHALLIGNSAYAHEPLKNPTHDARDLAKLLESLGFRVTLLENADLKTMKTAVKRFAQQLNNDSVGLFFFSGHGIQHEGKNYLLPVGTPIESSAELEYEALAGDFVADAMHESGSPTNLIFFDACRNNPLPFAANRGGQRGLAMMARGSGTLIAFATGPGHWAADGDGRNSPYTAALLRHLREPVVLEEMLRNVAKDVVQATGGQQQPWHHLSLLEAFYFNRSGSASVRREAPAETATANTPSNLSAAEQEQISPIFINAQGSLTSNLSAAKQEQIWQEALAANDEKNYARALELYHRLAAAGHAGAMWSIGFMYQDGRGVAQDYASAKRWYEKAGAAGNGDGYGAIGRLYQEGGPGLERNCASAKRWYEKAGDAGDSDGYGRIGELYTEGGPGLERNYASAKEWYEKQAAAVDSIGYGWIGGLYEQGGPGLEKDLVQACRYYQKGGPFWQEEAERTCSR